MLVVGVNYLYRLYKMGSTAAKLELSPDERDRWRSHRRSQDLWGIVAGWGSLVLYIVFIAYVSSCATSHCTSGEAANATLPGVVLSVVVLFGGMILSDRGRRAANRLRSAASATRGHTPDDAAGPIDLVLPAPPAASAPDADDPVAVPPADSNADPA